MVGASQNSPPGGFGPVSLSSSPKSASPQGRAAMRLMRLMRNQTSEPVESSIYRRRYDSVVARRAPATSAQTPSRSRPCSPARTHTCHSQPRQCRSERGSANSGIRMERALQCVGGGSRKAPGGIRHLGDARADAWHRERLTEHPAPTTIPHPPELSGHVSERLFSRGVMPGSWSNGRRGMHGPDARAVRHVCILRQSDGLLHLGHTGVQVCAGHREASKHVAHHHRVRFA